LFIIRYELFEHIDKNIVIKFKMKKMFNDYISCKEFFHNTNYIIHVHEGSASDKGFFFIFFLNKSDIRVEYLKKVILFDCFV
jgi:hypothetical protein